MSKVKIEGNASGTGTFTIAAPNGNTDRTLTLPDSAGEILLSDGDGSNLTGIAVGTNINSWSDSDSTNHSSTSTSFAGTGLSITLTPSSTSSKFLLMCTICVDAQGNDHRPITTIFRGSTNLGGGSFNSLTYHHARGEDPLDTTAIIIIDSPNTTSSVTYTVQFATAISGDMVEVRNEIVPAKFNILEIAE